MRALVATVLVACLVACGSDDREGQRAEEARAELRNARVHAFFAFRSTSALLRLGRAKLDVWDEEGAEETFRKAYKIDEKLSEEIGTAYWEAAKAIAARGPAAVARSPIAGRYAVNASRWMQSPEPRRWYFMRIARVLPQLDPAEREQVYRAAARHENLENDANGLVHYIGQEMNEAIQSSQHARMFALIEIVDRTSETPDGYRRQWLAELYAKLAKRIGVRDAETARHCITRAHALDARWTNDYELLNLRSRLPERNDERLSDLQKTANQLIQITVAATKYSRERGQFPRCDSIGSFLTAIAPYTEVPLSSSDAWGGVLECYVAPHGMFVLLKSSGPDRQFNRGEELSAWEAMHMTGTRDEADLSIEHGYVAPPWWSKEDVLALYR